MRAEVLAKTLVFFGSVLALPDLYFYWFLYAVAATVLRRRFIVSILLPIVSFSNHRPPLERYGVAFCFCFFLF